MSSPSPSAPGAVPRLAILSYSSAEFDARTQRIARSAVEAGWDVTVYARTDPALPDVVEADGYRIVRVATDIRLAIPGLRDSGRRRLAARRRTIELQRAGTTPPIAADRDGEPATRGTRPRPATGLVGRLPRSLRGTLFSPFFRGVKTRMHRLLGRRHATAVFPLRPMAWAVALEDAVEPADLWHGMWAGSLPALGRLRRKHGGKTVYDSRDIYLHSREFDRMGRLRRGALQAIERRWAQAADAVVTVNDAYADILAHTLRVPRPPVVMNCPAIWAPPDPLPDRIRAALKLPASTAVVLYQGNLITERGIEQSMDAILEIPDAALVLLGYGSLRETLIARAAAAPFKDRVFVLPPVRPSELLEWTASSDVMVMAIQPTSLNHRYTTPQKLFEALAAGVPVVASDLPGMADIVRVTEAGVLCDPTASASIAAAIRQVLEQPPADLAAMRQRARRAAQDTYNWDRQVTTLFEVYRRLLGGRPA
ncbi:MAG: glycosyltransferase [Chloroflexi bacterium]|nr:glycosyltransferase [Chloroflexota bacterium]